MENKINKIFDSDLFQAAMIHHRVNHRNCSLRKAAKAIGISPATLCRIETKRHIPDLNIYYKCCEWAKVPMDYFFK